MTRGSPFAGLTEPELRRRSDRLQDYLDAWGDLTSRDVGASGPRRLLEFAVDAPGQELNVEVELVYREYYSRGARGRWDIAKYTYEYLDVRRRHRLAYHLHDVHGRPMVPHAHCDPNHDPAEEEGRGHLRATLYDLREVHEIFMRFYASDLSPDCSTFLPLVVDRSS